jgi:hypothetical protein
MQPQNVSLACNVMGVSRLSCDASVETLPYLADNKVWVELKWHIEIKQLASFIAKLIRRMPVATVANLQLEALAVMMIIGMARGGYAWG